MGCDKNDTSLSETETTSVTTYSYLALGDSYTIGQSVSSSERWPVHLSELLAEENISIDSLNIIAETGWTTTNLQNAMNESGELEYDIVSLLIGVNNQYQGLSFSEFQLEFNSLLTQAEAISSLNKVFVVSIPDYGVTPFGTTNAEIIAEELNAYNHYMKEEAESRGIPFIDITEISRELGSNEGALATDDLHPSGEQYLLWAQEIKPVLLVLLED